jgi:hypothetical protein
LFWFWLYGCLVVWLFGCLIGILPPRKAPHRRRRLKKVVLRRGCSPSIRYNACQPSSVELVYLQPARTSQPVSRPALPTFSTGPYHTAILPTLAHSLA